MNWLLWLGFAAGLLWVAAAGLSAFGNARWDKRLQALASRLEAARIRHTAGPPMRFDAAELTGLPAPVQRYFRAVLTDGQPIISAATLEMRGRINLSATAGQWKPFTSWQRVITRRSGFLWAARVAIFPGVPVRVVDSYIAGQGLLQAAVLGLFPVADASGGGEIARGECLRFFAEAGWYPTALLPSQGVQWAAVDDTSANATLVDGPLTLTLLFRFNADGLIDSFRAEARGAGAGKDMVMLPWEGNWSNYQRRDGMLVPLTGEVAWMRPAGRKTYFHGTVTSLAYEWAV